VRYLSVCSGIEAATEAWHELGWLPEAFSEIEPFPCAVLKHHYPEVPNLGDMTKFKEWNIGPIDLLVGGTPCQSFSVAGLREGLADPRGNLMLTCLAIARRHRPRWLVWENVPGVLSSNGGEDFACLLRGLAELGYGFAYRVLDAQHFGVAQRRRRVFVVGYLGDWHPAAAVLLERSSLSGHPAPSREKREGATPSPVPGVANCLTNRMHKGINTTVDEGQTPIIELPEVMCTLRSSGAGFDRPGNASTEHETYIPTAYSIREDAIADNFSATPLEVSTALQSLRPSTQSHQALSHLLLRRRYAASRRGNANGCKVSPMTTPPFHGEAKRHPMVHGIRRWVIAWQSRSCAGLANASSRWRRSLTNDEKKHLSRVADLGCAVCRRMGFPGTPAEIHHKRAGTGAGRRSSHWETIPLCPEHHRGTTGLHGLGTKGFPKHWGFDEVDLLKETIELLTKTYPTKYDTPKKSD
jgi:DNA-cytosine methyltransferase